MSKKILSLGAVAALALPVMAFAQADLTIGNTTEISAAIVSITNFVVTLFVALAVLFFIWGAFLFATAGGDDDKKGKGKSYMINAIIGIFLIVSVWGIINLVLSTVEFGDNTANTDATSAVDRGLTPPAL